MASDIFKLDLDVSSSIKAKIQLFCLR